MLIYILRRLISTIPILLGVTIIVFGLVHLIPGDPVQAMLGSEADPAAVAALREELGLNRPVHIQYLEWVSGAVQGDLGQSIRTRESVSGLIWQRLGPTVELAAAAVLLSIAIAIPAGIISAIRRGGVVDIGLNLMTLLGISLPNFWLGILLILFFSLRLDLLPPGGYVSFAESPLQNLQYLILPAVTLGVALMAVVSRMTRSSVISVLNDDYIRTARAKGLAERQVVVSHALKNAMIPVTTVLGLQMGTLLGGAVITETIFLWPGIGKFAVDAIFSRDFPIVQGIVLLAAVVFIGVNLVVDIAYTFLDPRVRL